MANEHTIRFHQFLCDRCENFIRQFSSHYTHCFTLPFLLQFILIQQPLSYW